MENNNGNINETPGTDNEEVLQEVSFKKNKRLDKRAKIVIGAIIAIILIALIVIFGGWLADKNAYSEAEQLLHDQKYGSALKTLEPLVKKDYEDSKALVKYIKALQLHDKAENSNEFGDYKNAEEALTALKNYRDSKQYLAYLDATRDLRYWGSITTSGFAHLGEKYGKAGKIKGSDSLAAFFNNLADGKYEDAIASAEKYKKSGGAHLTSEVTNPIAYANLQNNPQRKEREKLNANLGQIYVACELNGDMFKSLSGGTMSEQVKSFKIKGLGKKPNGKILVITKNKPYEQSAQYHVNLAYTSLYGKERFPKSLHEVEYVVRVHEKHTFKSWYSGGGKKIPGVTESVYAEVYDVKKKKVIAKTKTKNGPSLKSRYTYGSTPSVVVPNWTNKNKIKKKLVKQLVKEIPKAKTNVKTEPEI